MFGLGWEQLIVIGLVGIFLLGPERIPTAVQWVVRTLTKVRSMAAGAQEQLRSEIGPELDELRRQVAELQSLKEIQELRDLRDLHPRRLIGNTVLGEQFSGGISSMLGLTTPPTNPLSPPVPTAAQQPAPVQPVMEQPLAPAAMDAAPVPQVAPLGNFYRPVPAPTAAPAPPADATALAGPQGIASARPEHVEVISVAKPPFGTPQPAHFDADAT